MRGSRIPLSALMLAVAIIAVDIALLRACYNWSPTVQVGGVSMAVSPTIFALGALPLGSVLIYLAGVRLAPMLRHGGEATFFVGFQMFGWAAVFLGLVILTLGHGRVIDMLEVMFRWLEPIIAAAGRRWPTAAWAQLLGELIFEYAPVAAIFTLPQLLFALLGGWLLRRAGIVVRIERRSSRAPRPSVLPLTVPPG